MRRPAVASRINRAHPLAGGLVMALLANEASGSIMQDALQSVPNGVLIGGASNRWGPRGVRCNTAVTDRVEFPETPRIKIPFPISVLVQCTPEDLSTTRTLFQTSSNGLNNNAGIGVSFTGTTGWLMDTGDGGTSGPGTRRSGQITRAITVGVPITLAAVIEGPTSFRMYTDGVRGSVTLSGTSPLTTGPVYPAGYTPTLAYRNTGSLGFVGCIGHVYLWNRALTDSEIAEVTAEPYEMFARQRRLVSAQPVTSRRLRVLRRCLL